MDYIIFDLEFNQLYNPCENINIAPQPKCHFEIIQIGALKFSEDLNLKDSFNKLVKPVIYPYLHPFVKELTSINEYELEEANYFKKVFEAFTMFIGEKDIVFVVWGMEDITQLINNINYHQVEMNYFPLKYINLQDLISKRFKCKKGTKIGLKNAIELMQIPQKDNFHNAYNDAYYTAEIFKNIYNVNIQYSIYKPSIKRNKIKRDKSKLDSSLLYKQIEKMYNIKLIDREKNMIKTAYMMGKTNQFQIEIKEDEEV